MLLNIAGLAERYESDGLIGLSGQIRDRVTRQQPTGSSIYLLTDAGERRIAGNLNRWPPVEESTGGWLEFALTDARVEPGPTCEKADMPRIGMRIVLEAREDREDFVDLRNDGYRYREEVTEAPPAAVERR